MFNFTPDINPVAPVTLTPAPSKTTIKLCQILTKWRIPEKIRSAWLYGLDHIQNWCSGQVGYNGPANFVTLDKNKKTATIHVDYWTFMVNKKHLKVNGVNMNPNEFHEAIITMLTQMGKLNAPTTFGSPYWASPNNNPDPTVSCNAPEWTLPNFKPSGSFGSRHDENPDMPNFVGAFGDKCDIPYEGEFDFPPKETTTRTTTTTTTRGRKKK